MWSVRASFFDHLRASVAGERRVLERDDFSSNRHPALSFCLSMISAQTLRVCREGKPVPTPHQVRGRLFPDHALERATVENDATIDRRPNVVRKVLAPRLYSRRGRHQGDHRKWRDWI